MSSIPKTVLALVVAGCALAACGGGSEQARERELEDYARSYGVDADVKVDKDGEVRSVTINQGTGQVGKNLSLPDNFPEDVPIYEGISLHAATPIPGGGISLSGIADSNLDDVAGFYATKMVELGWDDQSPPQSAPSQKTLRFVKGARNTMITLMPANPGTSVSVMVMNIS